jgi:hypothetical protein
MPAHTASHPDVRPNFYDHQSVVTFTSGLDAVYRLGGCGHRRVEANAPLRPRDVVVDGLSDAHERHAESRELERRSEGPITADDHERIETLALKSGEHGFGTSFVDVGVIEGGAQNSST